MCVKREHFRRMDVKKHPSLTNFLPMLQEIYDCQMTRLDQVQAGDELPLHNWKYLQLEIRLANYKDNFEVNYMFMFSSRISATLIIFLSILK